MKVSVIVCTRNRADRIAACLQSVADAAEAVPKTRVELIVVNNNSTDETSRLIEQWTAATVTQLSKVNLLFEQRNGLAFARNTGIQHSLGEIVVFTDDDCILSRSYLSEMISHYSRDAEPVIRGGRVELGDPSDLSFTIKVEDVPARLAYGTHPGGFVNGCNMTMSRKVIDKMGLFDERFGAGGVFKSAEDADYLYRALLIGIPVEYVPDMSVRHFHGRRTKESVDRLHFSYHFGNGALYAKFILRGPMLTKHFYWDARSAAKELLGGPTFNPAIGLTYRSIVKANICGMFSYWRRVSWEFLDGTRRFLTQPNDRKI